MLKYIVASILIISTALAQDCPKSLSQDDLTKLKEGKSVQFENRELSMSYESPERTRIDNSNPNVVATLNRSSMMNISSVLCSYTLGDMHFSTTSRKSSKAPMRPSTKLPEGNPKIQKADGKRGLAIKKKIEDTQD